MGENTDISLPISNRDTGFSLASTVISGPLYM
jgi:hypothetical protein